MFLIGFQMIFKFCLSFVWVVDKWTVKAEWWMVSLSRVRVSHTMANISRDCHFMVRRSLTQIILWWDLIWADFLLDWPGVCACLITLLSLLLVMVTFPLSLFLTVKVVKEYERAVIFRLGRLLSGGARGPGIFFILPCVDNYTKVDMRVITFDVAPQEVGVASRIFDVSHMRVSCSDPDPRLCYNTRGCHHVLQGAGRHLLYRQCRRLLSVYPAPGSHNSQERVGHEDSGWDLVW